MKNDFGSYTQPLPIVQRRFPWFVVLGIALLGSMVRASLVFSAPLAPGMNAAYYLAQAFLSKVVQMISGASLESGVLLAVKCADAMLPPLIAIPVFALVWRWAVRTGAGLWVPVCAALAAAIGAPALLNFPGRGEMFPGNGDWKPTMALLLVSAGALTAVWFRRKSLTAGNIAMVTGCALGLLALSGPWVAGDNVMRFRLIVVGLALICASFAVLQVRLPRTRNILATLVVLALVVPGAIRMEGFAAGNLAVGTLATGSPARDVNPAMRRISPPEHFHHRPCVFSVPRNSERGTGNPGERRARRVESWI
jgi:hypothetical protein